MTSTTFVINNNLAILKHIKTGQIISILLGSIFLALSAQVTIPFFPVPITMQTFAIMLISAFFGAKNSSKIVLLYLLEGVCGLPVFANLTSGLNTVFGPTGGYFIGFVFAAYLTGYLLQCSWRKNSLLIFMAALLGDITVFVCGYIVLAYFIGYRDAYLFGVVPFYFFELAKLALFTLIMSAFSRKIKIIDV
jgi:biotin transport system substrate-specific component